MGGVIDLNAVVICFNNFGVWQSLFISCDICLSKVLLLAIFFRRRLRFQTGWNSQSLHSPVSFTVSWTRHRSMKHIYPPSFSALLQLAVLNFQPLRHGRYAANEYKYLNWYVQEKAAILMNIHHLTCNFIRISLGSYPNLIRVLLDFLLDFYSNLIRISTFMWNLSQVYMRFFASLCEIFCKFVWNLLQVKKIYVPLHRFWKKPRWRNR